MIFLRIILAMIFFIGIILIGTFILSFLTDLIISLFDKHKGVYFNRMDWRDEVENGKTVRRNEVVKDENDIVVLRTDAPKENTYIEENNNFISEEENVTEIDFDKAVQEQKELQEKLNTQAEHQKAVQANEFSAVNESKPQKTEEKKEALSDEEFETILNDVTEEALKQYNAERKQVKNKEPELKAVAVEEKVEDKPAKVESKESEEVANLKAQIEKQQQ